ncbi:predicted protein [Plenodomus lingam JN3]|uniref:Predicted protein n=1 Tax=Leptosphaeria maculans (strain JN3 / isolate v23.1.3 / race Av1-4-5-6-7-8) TaxID=985895 RepID=E4ZJ17_LEPMJ|nr:predicted protein [Plenodomus lingam JN3]CBX91448.1 predicted protein [Plenodomus lingam JN3]
MGGHIISQALRDKGKRVGWGKKSKDYKDKEEEEEEEEEQGDREKKKTPK